MNYKDVVIDIKAMLESAEPPITYDCCIYRVPFDIRLLNQDAYTPKVISIGPFHHRLLRLQNMESHKLLYFNNFLQRAHVDVNLETLVIHVEQAEPDIRRSYADTLNFTKEELVKIILLDSCFIIELFWRSYSNDYSEDDALLSKPWLTTKINLDLLLIENQVPFFVLESLYNRAFASSSGHLPSFLELTFEFFDNNNSCNLRSDNVTIKHFTDLLRMFYLQQPIERRPRMIDIDTKTGALHLDNATDLLAADVIRLDSATELLAAGVRIKVNTKTKCLLDLKFSKGVLEIPKIMLEDLTEFLFRNVVALEQCHYPDESYVTDYVAVLDFLINTTGDVVALTQNGVLVNWLGDTESVSKLYNDICKNVIHSKFSSHYIQLCQDLNDFCRDPRHKLKATLLRDYGNSPWQAAASIAGIVLLLLSLLQSICSVLQVVQQCKAS